MRQNTTVHGSKTDNKKYIKLVEQTIKIKITLFKKKPREQQHNHNKIIKKIKKKQNQKQIWGDKYFINKM